jgi:alanine racemase
MHRLGVAPGRFAALADRVAASPTVDLAAVMTHFATADDDPEFMRHQRTVFEECIAPVRRRASAVWFHAANSAAAFRDPGSHYHAVRCGLALYGMSPFQRDPGETGLRPALTLTSYLAALQDVGRGEGVSYSLTWRAAAPTQVALVPIGYGDGFFRALSNRGEVLIRGRRYPRRGAVCMDQFLVDVGPNPQVSYGDRVTLIGRDGAERITAEDLARLLGTINYEITCSLTARVRRRYVGELEKGATVDG